MPKITKTEVIIAANPKHKGIVDLKTVGTDATGALVGTNGIRWSL